MDANKKHEIDYYTAWLIRQKARQLKKRPDFATDDLKDVEQELALDLLKRMPRFDPQRASFTTFVVRVLRHEASALIRERRRKTDRFRRDWCSLNETVEGVDGELIERSETLDQDEANIRAGKQRRTHEEEARLRFDISIVLDDLPDDLRKVADHLMVEKVEDAAESLGVHRATIYRAIQQLRRIFDKAGLRNYLQ